MSHETSYVRPEHLRIYTDESKNLCASVVGKGTFEKVTVKRAFPYTNPHGFIVLLQEKEEVGVIEDVCELDEESRSLLENRLETRYFIPEILSVGQIRETNNTMRWHVRTDRGEREFEVRDRHNFRRVRGGAVVIVDVDANRYRISAPDLLDERSRNLIEQYS